MKNNKGMGIMVRTSPPPPRQSDLVVHNDNLDLSLSSPTESFDSVTQSAFSPPPSPSATRRVHPVGQILRATRRRHVKPQPQPRGKKNTNTQQPHQKQQKKSKSKSETITPPFEWATNRRATVYSMRDLLSRQISSIAGSVKCSRCECEYEMEFDLEQKFNEVGGFISANKLGLHERAPEFWMNPVFPTCWNCKQENYAKPVIGDSKKAVNWLFLLLGQMLGACTLDQLRYFCKHTGNHRTGAKDRVLYLTYLTLCKQLDPTGPFDR